MVKGNILIVEDDKLIQYTTKEILKEFDFEVVGIFSSGEEAVYNAPAIKPDLILMDIELSGYMDGIEAAGRIKSVIDCPVIFMSGLDDESTVERSKCTDPLGYLLKPFKPRELIILIEMALYKFKTEKKLKLNEFYIKSTFNSISEGMISIDATGNVKLVNPAASKIVEISQNQIIKKSILELIKTKSGIFENFIKDTIESKKWRLKYSQTFENEFDIILNEKMHKSVNLSVSPLYDNQEKIMGYVIILKDLTEQKKTRELINKLYIAIKQSSIGVMMMSPDRKIEYVNPKFESITLYQAEEILGKDVSVIHHEKMSKDKVDEIWNKLIEGKELNFEWQNFKKDGTPYWEAITMSPVKNDKGELIQFISLKEDITEKKEYEYKLLQNEKKYKNLFNNTPVAIWYLDFHEVASYIHSLRELNIRDLKEYFSINPHYFSDCIEKIRVLDINHHTYELFSVKNENDSQLLFNEIFLKQNHVFLLKMFDNIYHDIESKNEEIKIILRDNNVKNLHIAWYASHDDDKKFSNILIAAVDITDNVYTESLLKTQTQHLKERIKEQKTLYEINNIIMRKDLSSDEVLRLIANQVILAFQHPGKTSAQIIFKENEYFSIKFIKYSNSISQNITIDGIKEGSVNIYACSDDSGKSDFSIEEIELIKTISNQISDYMKQYYQSVVIKKKLEYESLVSKISSVFLNMNDFRVSCDQSLSNIGKVSAADRIFIFEYDCSSDNYSLDFEWINPESSINLQSPNSGNLSNFPVWKTKILTNEIIYIKNVKFMTDEAHSEKELMIKNGIVSILILPLVVNNIVKGFISFEDLTNKQAWDEQDITLLKIYSDILSSAIERNQVYDLLKHEKEFSNAIINSVSESIIVLNINTEKVITFNNYSESTSGYTKEEISDFVSLKKLFIPEQLSYFINVYNQALIDKKTKNIELFWKTKDRKFLIINWQFNILKGLDNKPLYLILNGTDITELKKKELLLKDKELQYRTLIENLNIGIYRTTGLEAGHFLQANNAFARILGYDTVQELMLKREKDIYANSTDRDEMLKQAVIKGKLENYEAQLVKKDETIITALINAKVVYDKLGNFKWIDGFVEDITLQKKNKSALDFQLKFLQNLIDSIPVPVYYTDLEFVVEGCNKSLEKFLGYLGSEIIHKKLPYNLQSVLEKFDKELLINPSSNLYFEDIEIGGQAKHLMIYKAVLYSIENKPKGIVSTIIDVTELSRVQKQMRALISFNQSIISSINSFLITLDSSKRVTMWNSIAELVTNFSSADAMGKNILELDILWDSKQVSSLINKVSNEKKVVRHQGFVIKKDSQINSFFNITVSPIIREDLFDGYLLIGEDNTELQELHNQLLHGQKLEAIGQIAAGIAHEINTPAQFVTDNTEFLQSSFKDITDYLMNLDKIFKNFLSSISSTDGSLEYVRDFLDKYESLKAGFDLDFLSEEIPAALSQSMDGLKNISRIVRAMKDFSHPGVDEKTFNNINNLIESTVIVAKNEWKYYAEMKLELDPDLPSLLCLPGELNQSILNMIINAAHAIKEKYKNQQRGLITIRTHHDISNIYIEISDNGAGIPDDIKDKIFIPFFTTKEIGKGTGQGLNIVYQVLVEKHHGSIVVSSEPNQGTTFKLTLPKEQTV